MAEPRTQKAAERIEKRVFAKLDEAIKEASKKEAARRAVWLLEEQERRRRMREEAIGVAGAKKDPVHDEAEEQKFKAQEELLHVINYAKAVRLEEDARLEHQLEICKDQVGQDIIREITRTEVLIEEAKERKRRMEEPGGGYDPLLSDLHDKVQEQFMSEVSRKESKKLEEAERRRRVYIDRKIEQAQDFETAVERNLSYLKTIIAEENERDRRIWKNWAMELQITPLLKKSSEKSPGDKHGSWKKEKEQGECSKGMLRRSKTKWKDSLLTKSFLNWRKKKESEEWIWTWQCKRKPMKRKSLVRPLSQRRSQSSLLKSRKSS